MPTISPTILVVDDSPECRLPLSRLLRANGFLTQSACNGREALDGLTVTDATLPDLILLDLAMPIMDGLSFLKAFRGDPRWASVPVVVISGEPQGSLDAARGMGAAEAWSKGGFGIGELLAMIRRQIEV